MEKEEKIRKLKNFRNLLNEDEEPEDDDDRQILFDDFVQGLVSRLSSMNTQDLSTDDLQGSIRKHSLRKMFKADDKDHYYNYKNRYYKAPEIANSVMHVVQNGPDRADQMGDPKFVDYANISQDMSIFEKVNSESQQKLVDMACEYKQLDEYGDEQGIEEMFDKMPRNLREKVKTVAEKVSREKLKELSTEENMWVSSLDEGEEVSESEIREQVRDILMDFKKKVNEGKNNPSTVKREFQKAASSGNPRRYNRITIDPNIARKALKLADRLEMSEEAFFSKPVSEILAITTANI